MSRAQIALAVLWISGASVGWVASWLHASAAGPAAAAPPRWPAATRLAAPGARPVLLLFVHPLCPCTRASLDNLDRLLPFVHDRMDVEVIVAPIGDAPRAVLAEAAARPGVAGFLDEGGSERRRFGVETSGQALVYDQRGLLRFAGGITDARGHAGDSAGVDTIRALARGGGPGGDAPVYGCALDRRRAS